jgi:hypothetical protein
MNRQRDEPDAAFWPTGCAIADVQACADGGCDYCQRLLDGLERRERVAAGAEPATEAGDASLQAFAGGQPDD